MRNKPLLATVIFFTIHPTIHPTNRSLFDRVELGRNCPSVVDQALVHGMHHKKKTPTQANLEKKVGLKHIFHICLTAQANDWLSPLNN